MSQLSTTKLSCLKTELEIFSQVNKNVYNENIMKTKFERKNLKAPIIFLTF